MHYSSTNNLQLLLFVCSLNTYCVFRAFFLSSFSLRAISIIPLDECETLIMARYERKRNVSQERMRSVFFITVLFLIRFCVIVSIASD